MKKLAKLMFVAICLCSAHLHAQTSAEAPAANSQSSQDAENVKKSAEAAEAWLKNIDNGDYAGSWDAASMTFQLKIPKDSWISILESTRKPLGSVSTRKVLEQKAAVNPQGLPAGNYMVIFYSTTFSGNQNGNELITLQQADDGQWKVLTYLVK